MSPRRHRHALIAAFGLALVASSAAPAAAGERTRVAVLAFDSASADPAYASLGTGLQSMITTDLAEVGTFELVERARLAELQAELDLGASGAVDEATAARLGKLAGATALLAGSVTVVGEVMRIDARLFSTERGAVLLAEKIEGPAAEFFDLQKALVRKLIEALGHALDPRTRVRVERVHTVELEAFRRYSDGVVAFDGERWDEALAALTEASKLDPDFQLARLTLADYEQHIATIRGRAELIEVDRRVADRRRLDERAQRDFDKAEALWEVVRKDPGAVDPFERLWTTLQLYGLYVGGHGDDLGDLRRVDDRFAMQRTADRLARSYYAEVKAVFPRLPLSVDRVRAHNLRVALQRAQDPKRLREAVLRQMSPANLSTTARRLHLDTQGEIALLQEALALGRRHLEPDGAWQAAILRAVGLLQRSLLDLDASTSAFVAASKLESDARRVKDLATEVERNRDAVAALAANGRPEVRERMRLRAARGESRFATDGDLSVFAPRGPLSPHAVFLLTRERRIPGRSHVLVGDHPTWVFGSEDVHTGPRPEPMRTSELRFFPPQDRPERGYLAIFDGRPRGDLRADLRLVFAPDATWWPVSQRGDRVSGFEERQVPDSRPEVIVVFGLRDVDCRMARHPETDAPYLPRPMEGYGVRLTGSAIELVQVTEKARAFSDSNEQAHLDLSRHFKVLESRVLGTSRARLTRDDLPFALRVEGRRVQVTVGGERASFELPEAREGFYGVYVHGPGYVAVADPRIR